MFVINLLNKKIRKKIRHLVLISLLAAFPSAWAIAAWAIAGEPACFQCHKDLEKKCLSGIVHQAIWQDHCAGCHNPHTASFDHLLVRQGASLCYQCHKEKEEKWQRLKMHSPIQQQQGCLGCHEPHVSSYHFQVKANEQALCFKCHKAEDFQKKYVHKPAQEGKCQRCHDPHASREDFLLIAPARQLCLSCHGQKNLAGVHWGVEVRGCDCTLCHSPHASGSRGLVYDFSHKPYQERNCHKCHGDDRQKQRTLVAQGANLCYTCHHQEQEKFHEGQDNSHEGQDNFQGKSRKKSHMPSGSRECLWCHNPHASKRKGLTRREIKILCLSCHSKMAARLKSDTPAGGRHPEVIKGNCTSCHDPHSSLWPEFLKADAIILCTSCHIKQKKATHPVGEKAIDPRDRKTQIKCITCHDPMGTKFRYSLRLDGSRALCEQCHQKY